MNGCVRRLLMLFVLACSLEASAQNISVASFKLLANDLTANTTGTMERDQNGEIAALIKVVTSEQGFVFDGGMTGIVKTKLEIGEVWVYVPHGIKKMTIKHPQLGVLRDYYFPVSIDKAKTYELVLATGKVETIVTRSANKQYVIFNVNPVNAIVELDNMLLDVSSDGYAEKSMAFGTYNYRVLAANYHTEAGQVVVSAQGKSEVNVRLRPNFGWIDIKGANEYHGAHVYVDNEHVGQLPLKSDAIKSGVHQVKVMKSLYKPYEQQVTVTDDNTTSLTVELVPNFANVTFVTDAESEVWVDGKHRGKGQCSIALEIGDYTVEVKRASHRTVSEVVSISDITPRTIQLSSPTPIYGVLDITSTPSRATVYIDGVKVGVTPLLKSDVLIGIHEVAFEKEGYERNVMQMNVELGVNNSIKTVLENFQYAQENDIVVMNPKIQEKSGFNMASNAKEKVESSSSSVKTPEDVGTQLAVRTKHSDNYEFYINGKKQGEFSGDLYNIPSLALGEYKLKVKGNSYMGKTKQIISKEVTATYIKTKPRNNYAQTNMSIYAGFTPYAGSCYTLGFTSFHLGGVKLGGYLNQWNLELNYLTLFNKSKLIKDGWNFTNDAICYELDFNLGYGLNVWRRTIFTPRLGCFYEILFGFGHNSYFNENLRGITMGCQLQYQIFKFVAITADIDFILCGKSSFGSDEEFLFMKSYPHNLGASVVFTLPFKKKGSAGKL